MVVVLSLSLSLKDITDLVVVTRLKEIREVLNHDLIPQIYQVNGWDMTEMPKFTYEDFTQVTLDELSKTLQRIASVGGLVLGAEQMNWIHEQVGLPAAFQDVEITIEEAREVATGIHQGLVMVWLLANSLEHLIRCLSKIILFLIWRTNG